MDRCDSFPLQGDGRPLKHSETLTARNLGQDVIASGSILNRVLLDSEWVSSAEDAPVGVQGIIQLVRSRRRATPDAWVQEFLFPTVMREHASMTVVVESLKEAALRQ